MKRFRIHRRTFLRGAGAALALPWLEAMLPTAEAAEPTAKRLLFLFVPNGKHMQDWTPTEEGTGYTLPYLLEPLAPFREDMLVLSNLGLDAGRAHGDGPGDHARASATFLTGAHPYKTSGANIRLGVSVDQVAARKLGKLTRFPSLEVGCERGRQAGRCDSGYSCAYVSNVSWRSERTPNAKEVDPRRVFQRLFGEVNPHLSAEEKAKRKRYQQSILDLVREDAERLNRKLGKGDRRKVDEYTTALREVEKRISDAQAKPKPTMKAPGGIPRDYGEHIRLMHDLLVLAFQADLTRVATFMVANAGSNRSYRHLDVPQGHHHLSHHRGDEKKQSKIRVINRWHTEQLAHLIGKLKAATEGEQSLLDSSLVVYGSGLADGNRHNHHDLPILLFGKGGGAVTPGRHLRSPRRTPLCNLYLSMLHAAGVSASGFGDSTGPLKGLQRRQRSF